MGFGVGVVASVLLFRRKSVMWISIRLTLTGYQDELGPSLPLPGTYDCSVNA
jgi:hypothetical protein